MRYDHDVAHAGRGFVLSLGLAVGAAAYQPTLDRGAINDAIAIGQSRVDAARARYHLPYHLPVAWPPVDYVDVVTPFRRVVLAAEERARIGDRAFGQREALALLADRMSLALFVELTFHPLNTYVGVPSYDVTLADTASAQTITARRIDRIPRYGMRLDGMPLPYAYPAVPPTPGSSQPMLGGTLIAEFDNGAVKTTGMYHVIVEDNGRELARVRVDLAILR